jgi:hypothetical protein
MVFGIKCNYMNCQNHNSCCFISSYIKRRKYLKLFFISRLKPNLGVSKRFSHADMTRFR